MERDMGYEFNPLILEAELLPADEQRTGLLHEISEQSSEQAIEAAAETIGQDNNLFAMMSVLIERGPGLEPEVRDHLRRVIAVHVDGYLEAAVQAETNIKLYEEAAFEVRDEMNDLADYSEGELPEEWSIAMHDAASINGIDSTEIFTGELQNDFSEPEDNLDNSVMGNNPEFTVDASQQESVDDYNIEESDNTDNSTEQTIVSV